MGPFISKLKNGRFLLKIGPFNLIRGTIMMFYMYLMYLISQNVVSAQLMMFYLARKHCVNYDLEVIYCETASHKLKQKRKSLSFILKRNRDYLSSFVLLLWPNKRSTVWKLIESPTKRKHFCSYIFSSIRYL